MDVFFLPFKLLNYAILFPREPFYLEILFKFKTGYRTFIGRECVCVFSYRQRLWEIVILQNSLGGLCQCSFNWLLITLLCVCPQTARCVFFNRLLWHVRVLSLSFCANTAHMNWYYFLICQNFLYKCFYIKLLKRFL